MDAIKLTFVGKIVHLLVDVNDKFCGICIIRFLKRTCIGSLANTYRRQYVDIDVNICYNKSHVHIFTGCIAKRVKVMFFTHVCQSVNTGGSGSFHNASLSPEGVCPSEGGLPPEGVCLLRGVCI